MANVIYIYIYMHMNMKPIIKMHVGRICICTCDARRLTSPNGCRKAVSHCASQQYLSSKTQRRWLGKDNTNRFAQKGNEFHCTQYVQFEGALLQLCYARMASGCRYPTAPIPLTRTTDTAALFPFPFAFVAWCTAGP